MDNGKLDSSDFADERQIIMRVLKGDKDEFRHLVRAHQDRIYTVIRRQVTSEVIAKELAQEVFIKAYRFLPKFKFESTFSTWIIRIALNTTASYFKSKRYYQAQKTEAIENHLNLSEQDCSEEREKIKQLQQAMSSLKANSRDVLVLCGLESKSYEEAANILQIPVGTVKSRLNTARLELKQILAN